MPDLSETDELIVVTLAMEFCGKELAGENPSISSYTERLRTEASRAAFRETIEKGELLQTLLFLRQSGAYHPRRPRNVIILG